MRRDILTIKVPVPVPQIKKFSRWQVFLALFDPKTHFTTCETLHIALHTETERTAQLAFKQWNGPTNDQR